MGTSCRIVIKQKDSKIYLWMHYDGYFSGVGNEICKSFKYLILKYPIEQLQELVENIVEGRLNPQQQQGVKMEEIIEGTARVSYDDHADYNYVYVIDVYKQRIRGRNMQFGFIDKSFEDIKNGVEFTYEEDPDEDSDYDP